MANILQYILQYKHHLTAAPLSLTKKKAFSVVLLASVDAKYINIQ